MNITHHATKRFLERALKIQDYTQEQYDQTKYLLVKIYSKLSFNDEINYLYATVPGFENLMAIIQNNTLITITPKRSKQRRIRKFTK